MSRKQLALLFLPGRQQLTECLDRTAAGLSRSCCCSAGGPLLFDGIRLTMNSKVLNGSQRVVMDGVISAEECRALQRLTNVRNPGPRRLPKGPTSPPRRLPGGLPTSSRASAGD